MEVTRERKTMTKTEPAHLFSIGVVEVVGDSICVAQDDGQRLFAVLHDALADGQKVALSFAGVESLTTAFLNAAIGQLLRHFEAKLLRDNVEFRDLTGAQLRLLQEVIAHARLYFSDPERFDAARAQILEI
jgi:hypothetical protein